MTRLFIVIGCFCLILVGMAQQAFAIDYQFISIYKMNVGFPDCAISINDSGTVLAEGGGGYMSHGETYLWRRDTGLTRLNMWSRDYPKTFNNAGIIVGCIMTRDYHVQAAIWDLAGSHRLIGSTADPQSSWATDINDNGLIVGTAQYHAAVWNMQGEVVTMLETTASSRAAAVNNAGQVAWVADLQGDDRWTPYIWDSINGSRALSLLPDTASSCVMDINEAGQVVGYCGNHAVLWNTDGSVVDLCGTISGSDSYARAINNRGEIVGMVDGHAVVWSASGDMTYLPDSLGFGVSSSGALSINDSGLIVGTVGATAGDSGAGWQAVVWEPVPEPASFTVIAMGLVCAIVYRRKW